MQIHGVCVVFFRNNYPPAMYLRLFLGSHVCQRGNEYESEDVNVSSRLRLSLDDKNSL
jgi:hypothetical protein